MLPVYRECVVRALPVYTITRIRDVRGQTIDYERIALPFFEGSTLSDILMSAKLISEASRFELNNLFRVREKLPVPAIVRAVIDRDLAPCRRRSVSARQGRNRRSTWRSSSSERSYTTGAMPPSTLIAVPVI